LQVIARTLNGIRLKLQFKKQHPTLLCILKLFTDIIHELFLKNAWLPPIFFLDFSGGMRTFGTLLDLRSDWLMGKWSILIGRGHPGEIRGQVGIVVPKMTKLLIARRNEFHSSTVVVVQHTVVIIEIQKCSKGAHATADFNRTC